MSELGNLDDKQFQKFAERIGDEVRTQKILEKAKKRMDIVSDFAFANTVKGTPVDTGNLRRSWKKSDVEYTNKEMVVKITNNADYASFVENGHRKVNGGWQEGVFMNKNALDRTFEEKMNKTFHRELDNSLKQLFGD